MNKRILLLLITLVLVWFLLPELDLNLKDANGRVIDVIKVEDQATMVYHSIHSVTMTRLQETIRIDREQGFISTKVRYEDQGGAGLPEFPHSGGTFYIEDGWFVLEGYDRVFDELSFQVEKAYDNRLVIDGNQILLYHYWDRQQGVVNLEVLKSTKGLYYIKKGQAYLNRRLYE